MYDQSGGRVWQGELDSFGAIQNFKGDTKTDCPFRYQGQYEDAETGLYYNRFRYYSPEEGLYLSQDPIRLEGGDKLYGYVNDVNIFIDILGLKKVSPSSIRYSQDDIAKSFSDGSSVNDLAGRLMNDPNYINQVEPIRKVRMKDLPLDVQTRLKAQGAHGHSVFTLDNRRLYAAKKAGIQKIPSRWATKTELDEIDLARRFSTNNAGKSIEVRC